MTKPLSQWPWNVKAREWQRTHPRTKPYKDQSKMKDLYEQIPSVPDGLKWKPGHGPRNARVVTLYSIGNFYKLQRTLETGEVAYFQLKDKGPAATPKAQIDAEPERKQLRYRAGTQCWYVDNGRWFLMTVVSRERQRMVITSVTGWDVAREKEWPIGVELALDRYGELGKRLRPLKDRKP